MECNSVFRVVAAEGCDSRVYYYADVRVAEGKVDLLARVYLDVLREIQECRVNESCTPCVNERAHLARIAEILGARVNIAWREDRVYDTDLPVFTVSEFLEEIVSACAFEIYAAIHSARDAARRGSLLDYDRLLESLRRAGFYEARGLPRGELVTRAYAIACRGGVPEPGRCAGVRVAHEDKGYAVVVHVVVREPGVPPRDYILTLPRR